MIEFPPSFDIQYYRNAYPELQMLSDDVITEHWKRYAKEQGHSTCTYDRREYLALMLKKLNDENDIDVLELGPFDSPFCSGKNVKYFDVLNADGLRKRAKEVGRNGIVPKHIDYVSPTGDLTIIDQKFDIVFSSHVIEHQPDFIKHLQLIEGMLKDEGLYILLIPDKRYCFDYYLPASSLSSIMTAFVEKHTVHSFKSLMEHRCMTTHNVPFLHWLGEHGSQTIDHDSFTKCLDEYMASNGKYIDVHAWQFTPDSFAYIIETLHQLNIINLSLYRICNTIWGRPEFCSVLRKT